MGADLLKVLLPGFISFFIGIGITPLVAHYLYTFKAWKKSAGKVDLAGNATPIFNALHKDRETGTPRMGGIIIWASVALTVTLFWVLAYLLPSEETARLDFLSRSQTWLPFTALLIGALVGLIDDILEVQSSRRTEGGLSRGLSLSVRLSLVAIVAFLAGWWFYAKLDVLAIAIPFNGDLFIGWGVIPLFVFIAIALYTSGVIDGIDGLAGGVLASVFAAYTFIAFTQNQMDLAAFSAAVLGALLAFLWFNVPPARFYMSETGSMALMLTLTMIVFLTDTLGHGEGVLLLPVIGFLLVVTAGSSALQIFWKKVFHRKLFRIAPLHHYFEALGWPPYKVTMRYWILSLMCAFFGVILALLG